MRSGLLLLKKGSRHVKIHAVRKVSLVCNMCIPEQAQSVVGEGGASSLPATIATTATAGNAGTANKNISIGTVCTIDSIPLSIPTEPFDSIAQTGASSEGR